MPTEPKNVACQPGALFCLRRNVKNGGPAPADSQNVNPLAPYYLVYVHDDGMVRFSFAQPKECLILLRDLCAQKEDVYEKLCDLFDTRTKNGADMNHYDGLIQKVLVSITRTFQRRATAALLAGRGGILPTAAETPQPGSDDFELITWVVILATKDAS